MSRYYVFGEWLSQPRFSAELAEELCLRASERIDSIADYPLALIYELFDAVARKWAQLDYPRRKKMQDLLPETTGFSDAMIKKGLDEIANLFDSKALQQKVTTEFRGIPRGSCFKYCADTQRLLRWHPLGSVLHVLSGNVFLVGPGSFLEGVLTGNVTILKQSSSETSFMPEFIESLIEAEKELGHEPIVSRSLAVIEYSAAQKDVIDTMKRHVDGLVIWGGEQAVQAYRNDVPARTRVVVFGPKLSLACVTEEGINGGSLKDCARKLALELCIWDQNACTAPQVCFVQGENNAKQLASALQLEIESLENEFPPGKLDINQAAEIRKWRSISELVSARGLGESYLSEKSFAYTILLENEIKAIEPSPLHRTIKIYPFTEIEDITEQLGHMRAYVQTVGFYGSSSQFSELSLEFGRHGILRMMPLGKMSGEDIDDPHDGAYDLTQLMNLVVSKIELPERHMRPFEFFHKSQARRIINENFLMALRAAKANAFYASRLAGLDIRSIDDLAKIPLTEKADFQRHLMPNSADVAWRGGYVTRSGGTTGEPKFSYFDLHDWNAMVKNAAEIFRSCGFDGDDRVANCLFAGDLYGSFISFNDVNRELGMTSFPFAGSIDEDTLLHVYDGFHFNSLQGFPAVILPLLRRLHQRRPDFKIDKIMYAGQPMSLADRAWLQDALDVKVLVSVIGTTEAGQLAYQSSEDSGAIHSLIDDYNYIEIVGENGEPVADGEKGDIVVTSLFKYAFPLLRFRIGDRGRILAASRQDPTRGRVMRKLEYLGRADNILTIGPMNVNYQDFASALEHLDISLLQLVADYARESDRLEVNIESSSLRVGLKDDVVKALKSKIHELELFTNEGKVAMEVKVYRPGELQASSRTGKVKRVLDRRFSR